MTRATTHAPHAHVAVDLEAIASLSDPIGVLSLYVDADPALIAGGHSAWRAPVRTGLRRLVNHMRHTRPRAEQVALVTRLQELEQELDALLDPRLPGRGRALFAAISGNEFYRVELRAPFAPLARLERAARVLPLFTAWQECKPAGVATVSWDRLVLAEWEFDALHELEAFELAEPQPRRPRSGTNPAVPQPFPERDRFESAHGTRVMGRLRDAAARIVDQSRTRDWDVLVLDGDPRLLGVLRDALRTTTCQLASSSRPIAGIETAVAVDRVASIVRDRRCEARAELLGTLGASPATTLDPLVLERSLDEGRVEHLLIAASARRSQAAFCEKLLRRALETGAEVTIVAHSSHEIGASGVAGILRW